MRLIWAVSPHPFPPVRYAAGLGSARSCLMPGRFSHDLQRTHEKSNAFRCRRDGRWPQFRDQQQDVGE
jgi:hypothetical protein